MRILRRMIALLAVAAAAQAAEVPSGLMPDRKPAIPPEVVAAGLRRSVPIRDQALFRKLSLTPAQQEEYVALQVDRILSRDRDILTMKVPVGADADTVKAMGQAIGREKAEEFFRHLTERLGPSAAISARTFENTIILRQQADQVQQVLVSMAAPLPVTDVDRLADIIIGTSVLGPDGRPLPGGKSIRIDATVAAAGAVLTRPQQAVLRQILTDHATKTAARQRANDLADSVKSALLKSGTTASTLANMDPLVEIILAGQREGRIDVDAVMTRAAGMFSAAQLPIVRQILNRSPGSL